MFSIPKFSIRLFSSDQYNLDKNFYHNSYGLIPFKNKESAPVIVDIGANIGTFSLSSIALGAKKVYSIEPFIENYQLLLENIKETSNIIPYQVAITSENGYIKLGYPVIDKSMVQFSNIEPFNSNKHKKFYISPSVTLDYLLTNYISENTIDILKINIGYQEMDILISSSTITTKVQSICGETVIDPEYIPKFKNEMTNKGFVNNHIVNTNEQDNKIFFIFSKDSIDKYYNTSI